MAFSHISFFPLLLLTLSGHSIPCRLPLFTLCLTQGLLPVDTASVIALTEFWPLVQTQMAFTDTPIRVFIQEWFDDYFYTDYIRREAYKISELTESGPLGGRLSSAL